MICRYSRLTHQSGDSHKSSRITRWQREYCHMILRGVPPGEMRQDGKSVGVACDKLDPHGLSSSLGLWIVLMDERGWHQIQGKYLEGNVEHLLSILVWKQWILRCKQCIWLVFGV